MTVLHSLTVGLICSFLSIKGEEKISNTWQCWQFLRRLSKSADSCNSSAMMSGLTAGAPANQKTLRFCGREMQTQVPPTEHREEDEHQWLWNSLLCALGSASLRPQYGSSCPAWTQQGSLRRKASPNLDKVLEVTPAYNRLQFLTASTAEWNFNSLNFPHHRT